MNTHVSISQVNYYQVMANLISSGLIPSLHFSPPLYDLKQIPDIFHALIFYYGSLKNKLCFLT